MHSGSPHPSCYRKTGQQKTWISQGINSFSGLDLISSTPCSITGIILELQQGPVTKIFPPETWPVSISETLALRTLKSDCTHALHPCISLFPALVAEWLLDVSDSSQRSSVCEHWASSIWGIISVIPFPNSQEEVFIFNFLWGGRGGSSFLLILWERCKRSVCIISVHTPSLRVWNCTCISLFFQQSPGSRSQLLFSTH